MALMNRVSRLLRADIHAVLDRLEEPDVLLQQAIRDMEGVIAEHGARLESQRLARAQGLRRLEELSSRHREMEQQLDAALSAGNREVARTVVRRQLENRSLAAVLDERLEALSTDAERLEAMLVSQHNELEAMRQQAQVLARRSADAERDRYVRESPRAVTDDEVDAALLREIELRRKP